MPPPDARLALAGGAVDAWSVWDPYVSIAIADDGAHVLADATGVYGNKSFDLAHLDAIAGKRAGWRISSAGLPARGAGRCRMSRRTPPRSPP